MRSRKQSSRPDAWGVAGGYEDALGQWQTTDRETQLALHQALRRAGERLTPDDPRRPIVVKSNSQVEFPDGCRIRLEDGSELTVDGHCAADLPLGWHQIETESHAWRTLIVAAPQCYLPREPQVWGWSVQLYAARSAKSWGIGDLADLRRLAAWCKSTGAAVLLINPLAADTPAAPPQPSPYSPSSRCFGNPIYIAVEEAPGAAQAADELAEQVAAGRALNASDRIDRRLIVELKDAALRQLFARFSGESCFDAFRRERGKLLVDFTRFCALACQFGRDWRHWPAEYQHPRSAAVERFAAENQREIDYHAWLQWVFDQQLEQASKDVRLMQDLPIGVDPGGADAWMWQDAIAGGVTVGAPPDHYNPAGQNWGLAAFAPHALQRMNYEPFAEVIRASLRWAGGLRIDHIMGLYRLFWIPPDSDARAGAYVHFPIDDLLSIVALESQRAQAPIVGEDLGTLDPVARKLFAQHNILSYRLLWFEETHPEDYPTQAMAAVSTHDLPTVAGLWTGQDERDMAAAGVTSDLDGWSKIRARLQSVAGLDDNAPLEQVVRQTYRALARAPCRIIAAAVDDALLVPHRPNMPSTTSRWPNWSQPLPGGLEALEASELAKAIAEELQHVTVKPDRNLPASERRG